MGAAMALRLVGAGHHVTVWNRTAETADALVEQAEGVRMTAAPSPEEAVAGCDVVLSMLASGDVTCDVLLAPPVVQALAPGCVVVDLGTSGVTSSALLARGLKASGHRYVDAPVSGSVPAVTSGTLLVMASGHVEDVDAVREVLGAFASRILHVGKAGHGQVMKLVVNLVVHDLNSALSEALALAHTAGISPDLAYTVLEQSVVGAPFVQYKRAAFLDPQTAVAMSLDLVGKDLGLITTLAGSLGVPVVTTSAVQSQVDAARGAGYGQEDMAALTRWVLTSVGRPARGTA